MGIDRVGIVSIQKTSKNKQIFIDRVRSDRIRNDRLPFHLEQRFSKGPDSPFFGRKLLI